MRIDGCWYPCDDEITRPIVHAEILTGEGDSKSKPIRALGRSLDLAAPQQAWQLLATGSFPLRGNGITQLSTEKLQRNV